MEHPDFFVKHKIKFDSKESTNACRNIFLKIIQELGHSEDFFVPDDLGP